MVVKKPGFSSPEVAATLALTGSPIVSSVLAGVLVFVITRVLDRVFFGRT